MSFLKKNTKILTRSRGKIITQEIRLLTDRMINKEIQDCLYVFRGDTRKYSRKNLKINNGKNNEINKHLYNFIVSENNPK